MHSLLRLFFVKFTDDLPHMKICLTNHMSIFYFLLLDKKDLPDLLGGLNLTIYRLLYMKAEPGESLLYSLSH